MSCGRRPSHGELRRSRTNESLPPRSGEGGACPCGCCIEFGLGHRQQALTARTIAELLRLHRQYSPGSRSQPLDGPCRDDGGRRIGALLIAFGLNEGNRTEQACPHDLRQARQRRRRGHSIVKVVLRCSAAISSGRGSYDRPSERGVRAPNSFRSTVSYCLTSCRRAVGRFSAYVTIRQAIWAP